MKIVMYVSVSCSLLFGFLLYPSCTDNGSQQEVIAEVKKEAQPTKEEVSVPDEKSSDSEKSTDSEKSEPTQEPSTELVSKEEDCRSCKETTAEVVKETRTLEKTSDGSSEQTKEQEPEVVPSDGKSCKQDSDCGSPSCNAQRGVCHQETPTCDNGTCIVKKTQKIRTQCLKSGKCGFFMPTTGCTTACDCTQGKDCVAGVGVKKVCRAGVKPVYCCSKSGCVKGKTCVEKNGSKGICK